MVQDKFIEGYALQQAWLSINQSEVLAAIEIVRNRLLTFSLEVEKYVPGPGKSVPPSAESGITQVFNTVVMGDVSSLAQASHGVTQSNGVTPGNLGSLIAAVKALGVNEADIASLSAAVEADGPSKDGVGTRVLAWMGRMIEKAAAGTWSVATKTAASVLPKVIERFYGL
jgi:hypothetical protein